MKDVPRQTLWYWKRQYNKFNNNDCMILPITIEEQQKYLESIDKDDEDSDECRL